MSGRDRSTDVEGRRGDGGLCATCFLLSVDQPVDSPHFETHTPPGVDLIPERVKRWKIKECQGIAKKIKDLSKQKAGSDHHKIEVLDDKPEKKDRGDKIQDELWQEMMKSKEERQFQIGRITTYFS